MVDLLGEELQPLTLALGWSSSGRWYGASPGWTTFWRALGPEQRRRVTALGQAERRANAAHGVARRALRGGW